VANLLVSDMGPQLRPLFLLTLLVASAATMYAGDWHYGTSAVCSDCHTQHNSQNGQPMRTDNNSTPASYLLRRGTSLDLCLSCHDGSNPNAPDVITPISYLSETAAGVFPNSGGIPTNLAHHLNNPSAEVPPGGTQAMVLVCTTCHDPHGNANYRNLRSDPSNTNHAAVSIMVVQQYTANGSNPSQVYAPSNVIYKSGVSQWCSTCHGTPHTDHVNDPNIWSSKHASYGHWNSEMLPRVPVLNPTDNVVPSHDDAVMCLSCHKAHGSNNPQATMYADGSTLQSTCQECHNK
jgi:predicted CXXCH cytochrome family protein